ncbi:MAG: AAA family ATPase [Deltaproteobacteria bacterium]|jgi:predicted ATPase|nr:AAA family ATPase [Deltaproteobacteria bacterium]MBK7065710.1 AAA family ATPase [Deltaproteobacteria bacterium]MBP6831159.1 AAA family ATPase [Deltaproteobacteria bacterium]HAM21249.1 ATPase [Actinomycetota bacterium]
MARLLGIRIKNFRSLKDVAIGQVKYGSGEALPSLICFIGPNGSGKSTLLDAFGFIADCLKDGVEPACDAPHRGGIDRLRSQGSEEPIEFEIFFDSDDEGRPIVYNLQIGSDEKGIPVVVKESLRQRRKGEAGGKPYYFLSLKNGAGKVWAGQHVGGRDSKLASRVKLDDRSRLGIGTLGNLSDHPRITMLRRYIEEWYLSYFVPDAARERPPAGAQRWLDRRGGNVGNVLQYFQRQDPENFEAILKRVTASIPGIKKITVTTSDDKRLLLKFDERGYKDPFFQQSMSDGTLKMLAYSVLLADPAPRPFIGIEEPENGLYVQLIEVLAAQFVQQTRRKKAPTQILVTTHSPYFVDALKPDQVWLIRKGTDGFARAKRVADLPNVAEMVKQGIPLGSLWYSEHFGRETEADE